MKNTHLIHPEQATTSGQGPGKGETEGGRRPTGGSPFPDATDKPQAATCPATEVMEDIPRRTFSAQYKLRILQEADACAHGQLGALLRREGLYYFHIKDWREQRDAEALDAFSKKPGRKKTVKNALNEEKTNVFFELATMILQYIDAKQIIFSSLPSLEVRTRVAMLGTFKGVTFSEMPFVVSEIAPSDREAHLIHWSTDGIVCAMHMQSATCPDLELRPCARTHLSDEPLERGA